MTNELDNALPCPKCANKPIAIIKTPEFIDKDGILREAVHEVGCIVCWPELEEDPGGKPLELGTESVLVKRVSYSARALSVEEATEKWNVGDFVVDYHFDRCPMTLGDLTINPR